jgi:hypothetical protein
MQGNGTPRALNSMGGECATADIECDSGGKYGRSLGDSEGDSRGLSQGNYPQSSTLNRRTGDRNLQIRVGYLREPRVVFFRFDWRCFVLLRFGLLMIKVPLPTYSAL